MACLTSEQLTQVALGLVVDHEVTTHVERCDACRAAFGEVRSLIDTLAAAHATLDRGHEATRSRLLESLRLTGRPVRQMGLWKRFISSLEDLTMRQRITVGGVGFSMVAAVVLVWLTVASSTVPLSAMDRIVKAVREVTSFSYKWANQTENPPTPEKPSRTFEGVNFVYWRAPQDATRDEFGDFRGAMRNEAVYHRPIGDSEPEVLGDLIEIHPSGERGILIDYLARKYYRVPPLHADDVANSPPILWLRAVREQTGRIIEDLGTREIGGREARGYVTAFDDVAAFDDVGPVEVWLDPQTDLPVEFSFRRSATAEEEGFTARYSVTGIQWNADFDPKLFDTTPPAGFLDVTMPEDEPSIAEIVAALRLYAELSGGRYPHVEKLDDRHFATKFDAAACYREMLDLAGFAGLRQAEWADDPMLQRIEQCRPGLDTLQRIFQSYKWLIGYNGPSVGSDDKDRVLLWWNVALDAKDDQYRVFYGDLRTEIVPRSKWIQFVPPEIAEFGE